MARKVRSAADTRNSRAKLPVQGKPHWYLIERGLHLGYRKLKGKAGTWWARHYLGEQQYETEALGIADDLSDADGVVILDYWQVQEKARARRQSRAHAAAGITGVPTVRDVVETYTAHGDARESRRRGREVRSDASQRLARSVLGQPARGDQPAIPEHPIAKKDLRSLKEGDLVAWRKGLPETVKETSKQRLVNDLKAALNAGYLANRGQLDPALPGMIKYGLLAPARTDDESEPIASENQILDDAKITRLLKAAKQVDAEQGWDGDLYRLVVAMAATGARFSQVARIRVSGFQPKNGRLIVPTSRKGKATKKIPETAVAVGADALAALAPVASGRTVTAPLLERWRHAQATGGAWERTERGAWQKSEITRPWDTIRERARLPEVKPYALRHSSIVRGIRAGLPIRLVAALHDTSVAMIERHYSKYIVDGLEQLAAKAVVPLLPKDDASRVVKLRTPA